MKTYNIGNDIGLEFLGLEPSHLKDTHFHKDYSRINLSFEDKETKTVRGVLYYYPESNDKSFKHIAVFSGYGISKENNTEAYKSITNAISRTMFGVIFKELDQNNEANMKFPRIPSEFQIYQIGNILEKNDFEVYIDMFFKLAELPEDLGSLPEKTDWSRTARDKVTEWKRSLKDATHP